VSGLVWSPGAGRQLVHLIDSARRTLVVENEEMGSPAIEAALVAAARRGVTVEVVITARPAWHGALAELAGAGARVDAIPNAPGNTYIHAKAAVADGAVAFVGSENFSNASLVGDRELGVITGDPAVVGPLSRTLDGDFSRWAPTALPRTTG
jgi:phosphatidylserine/phosphatidylglycerophosphate/cardiolipin synthase-like enzyme